MNTPDFSEWINSSAHNCIVGCMRCQECCPVNRNYLNRIVELEEFSEDETKMIMQGTDKSKLSDKTVEKLEMLNLMVYYDKLARNIRVLLEDK
jgi:epoxyqueuosine reductase